MDHEANNKRRSSSISKSKLRHSEDKNLKTLKFNSIDKLAMFANCLKKICKRKDKEEEELLTTPQLAFKRGKSKFSREFNFI